MRHANLFFEDDQLNRYLKMVKIKIILRAD